jgi:NAD-dependent SIR2 family protein deacetylase
MLKKVKYRKKQHFFANKLCQKKKNVNFTTQNSCKLLGRLHTLGNSALVLKGVERLIFLD